MCIRDSLDPVAKGNGVGAGAGVEDAAVPDAFEDRLGVGRALHGECQQRCPGKGWQANSGSAKSGSNPFQCVPQKSLAIQDAAASMRASRRFRA